jgi:predicted RNA-binding Zn-ribbon protein involved in translation (DUF1610 family)
MADVITKCGVCNSLVDEEDLFCPNCGTEAPRRQQEGAAADSARLATHNFECSGCGASMSYDAAAEALRCPFCGSVDLREKQDANILAPNRVVPFRLSRQEAEAGMRQWLGRGFWRPGDLARQAGIVKIAPVYVPYWVFQAQTHTYWTADTSHTPPGARGDWCPLSGEHRGSYAGLLIGASGALAPRETSAICPFNLAEGRAPDQVDLDNVTVEQFSLPRKYARPLARQGLEQAEAQACQSRYVPGRARNVHVNLRIESMSSEPVLLPVWIMAYRYRDTLYRFLLNGQTGRATGQAPVSLSKILVAVVIVIAVLLLVLLLASGLLGQALGRRFDVPPPPRVQVSQRLSGKLQQGWLWWSAATPQIAFSGGSLRSTPATHDVPAAFRIASQRSARPAEGAVENNTEAQRPRCVPNMTLYSHADDAAVAARQPLGVVRRPPHREPT